MGFFSKRMRAAEPLRREPVRVAEPSPTGDPNLDKVQLALAYSRAMPDGRRPITAGDVTAVVSRWLQWMADERWFDVWMERLEYGYGADLDTASQPDRFWFNALPAVAGLNLGYRPHPALAMMAGVAESDRDSLDAMQEKTCREIRTRFQDY